MDNIKELERKWKLSIHNEADKENLLKLENSINYDIICLLGLNCKYKDFLISFFKEQGYNIVYKSNYIVKGDNPIHCLYQLLRDIKEKTLIVYEGRTIKSRRQFWKVFYFNNINYINIYINPTIKMIKEYNDELLDSESLHFLREKFKTITLPVKDIIINLYDKETSYSPIYKEEKIIEGMKAKDRVNRESNRSYNTVQKYLSSYFISYERDEKAKEKLEECIQWEKWKDFKESIENLNWKSIIPEYTQCLNYNQNNENHLYTLSEHMIRSAYYIREVCKEINIDLNMQRLITLSLLFHDIGKPYCLQDFGILKKSTDIFTQGEKVEIKQGQNGFIMASKATSKEERSQLLLPNQIDIEKNSHFYNHQQVSANIMYKQLGEIGYSLKEINIIYTLIVHHMSISANSVMKNFKIRVLIEECGELILILPLVRNCDALATGKIFERGDDERFMINVNKIIKEYSPAKGNKYLQCTKYDFLNNWHYLKNLCS